MAKKKIVLKSTLRSLLLCGLIIVFSPQSAQTASCTSCNNSHANLHENTRKHFDKEMEETRDWITDTWWVENFEKALKHMTAELSLAEQQRTAAFARSMDGLHAKEDHTVLASARADIQKSYTPNPTIGEIASQLQGLPASQKIAATAASQWNAAAMQRILATGPNQPSAKGVGGDVDARVRQYQAKFCDRGDGFCGGGSNRQTTNADVTSISDLMSGKLSIDCSPNSTDSENIQAMMANFVGPTLPVIDSTLVSNAAGVSRPQGDQLLLKKHGIAAKMSVLVSCLAENISQYCEGDPVAKKYIEAESEKRGNTPDQTKAKYGKNPSPMAQYHNIALKVSDPTFHTDTAGMNEDQLARLETAMQGIQASLQRETAKRQDCITKAQALMLELDVAEQQAKTNSVIRAAVRDSAQGN